MVCNAIIAVMTLRIALHAKTVSAGQPGLGKVCIGRSAGESHVAITEVLDELPSQLMCLCRCPATSRHKADSVARKCHIGEAEAPLLQAGAWLFRLAEHGPGKTGRRAKLPLPQAVSPVAQALCVACWSVCPCPQLRVLAFALCGRCRCERRHERSRQPRLPGPKELTTA